MSKKKIPKSRKARLIAFGIPCIVAFVVCIFNVITYSYKIIALSNEEKMLVKKLDDLKTEKELLDIEIEKLQDSEYLARYAREKYYYTKDGEYVIKSSALKEQEIEDVSSELNIIQSTLNTFKNNGKLVVFLSLGMLLFIIVQVIRRK